MRFIPVSYPADSKTSQDFTSCQGTAISSLSLNSLSFSGKAMLLYTSGKHNILTTLAVTDAEASAR